MTRIWLKSSSSAPSSSFRVLELLTSSVTWMGRLEDSVSSSFWLRNRLVMPSNGFSGIKSSSRENLWSSGSFARTQQRSAKINQAIEATRLLKAQLNLKPGETTLGLKKTAIREQTNWWKRLRRSQLGTLSPSSVTKIPSRKSLLREFCPQSAKTTLQNQEEYHPWATMEILSSESKQRLYPTATNQWKGYSHQQNVTAKRSFQPPISTIYKHASPVYPIWWPQTCK